MKRPVIMIALVSLSLAACGTGNGDVSPEVFKQALVAQGLDEEVSQCVTNSLSEQLSEDDFSTVALVQKVADLSPELEQITFEAVRLCTLGE